MRIMSPPKFIMNISLIMRLIIALIVFQCTQQREPRRAARLEHDEARGGDAVRMGVKHGPDYLAQC